MDSCPQSSLLPPAGCVSSSRAALQRCRFAFFLCAAWLLSAPGLKIHILVCCHSLGWIFLPMKGLAERPQQGSAAQPFGEGLLNAPPALRAALTSQLKATCYIVAGTKQNKKERRSKALQQEAEWGRLELKVQELVCEMTQSSTHSGCHSPFQAICTPGRSPQDKACPTLELLLCHTAPNCHISHPISSGSLPHISPASAPSHHDRPQPKGGTALLCTHWYDLASLPQQVCQHTAFCSRAGCNLRLAAQQTPMGAHAAPRGTAESRPPRSA